MSGTLLIVRHGESEWNAKGVWTGTTDVHLTAKGFAEAAELGKAIRDFTIDYAYCSEQIRTLETLEAILDASGNESVSYERSGAINERDYGDYTGKNKWEVQKAIGQKAFEDLRRGWDVAVPNGETLKKVYERVVPFYLNSVVPRLIRGQTVLLVAHGNSIRSLMKYVESISDTEIANVEMIFGEILIYTVNKEGKQLNKDTRKIQTTPPPA